MEHIHILGILVGLALVVALVTPRIKEAFEEGIEQNPNKMNKMIKNDTFVLDPTTGRLVRAEAPRAPTGGGWVRAPPSAGPDAIFVAFAQHLANQFVDHVKFMYPNDERAIPLVKQWKKDVQLSGGIVAYDKLRGRLTVNPQHPDVQRPDRLRSKILHELAHSRGDAHDDEWRQTWHWFLRIATTELGWQCTIRPSDCKKYGLCLNQQCPRCTWQT